MPRMKTRAMDDTAKAAQDNGTVPSNKMEAMRLALQALGGKRAKPRQLQAWLLDKYNIDMPADLISNYKSSILKKGGIKGKGGRPRKVHAEEAATPAIVVVTPPRRVTVSIEDVRILKELADRIGADQVVELVGMVGS
jgi:hypothetical protein